MRHKAIWKNRTILVEDTIHVEKTTQNLLNPKKVWYIPDFNTYRIKKVA